MAYSIHFYRGLPLIIRKADENPMSNKPFQRGTLRSQSVDN